jgi:glycosyltransferase involved in cell wall biosynthesis
MHTTAELAPSATTNDPVLIEDATVVCFSHLRWDFVYQRPQHLLSRFAQRHDIFFIEEPIFEDVAEPALRLTPRGERVQVGVPVLPHGLTDSGKVLAQRQLVDRLLAGLRTRKRIFWYYTPMALLFSRHLDADVVVFDSMDELSAFKGAPPELLALEEELMGRADVVFTGGHSLFEAKKHRHHDIHAFPSSIDARHFAQARAAGRPEPEDQSGIPHPRLGFFGVVDERFDVELLRDVAALKPDWQFVMIGPVVKIDPADLPRADNIHWLGGRDYKALPDYLGGWDIGFMPFARNESTRFISPTKTPEFLAAGLPVVSTPIHDVIRSYGEGNYVEIAEDAASVVKSAEELMAMDRGPWLQRVDQKLAESSWDQTFERIYELVARAHDRRHARSEGAFPGKESFRV